MRFYYKDFCFKIKNNKTKDIDRLNNQINKVVCRLVDKYSLSYGFISNIPNVKTCLDNDDFIRNKQTVRIRFKTIINGDKS